ncbi:hypothetical protein CHUAL_010735 [Chamberlinius hualienensis]
MNFESVQCDMMMEGSRSCCSDVECCVGSCCDPSSLQIQGVNSGSTGVIGGSVVPGVGSGGIISSGMNDHHHHHHHPHHHHLHPAAVAAAAAAAAAAHHHQARINMLPFEALPIYEQKPRFIFKMPRVVPDQKAKFESDELFRRLSRESEIRYTGYRDRPLEERQMRFHNGCREGHTDVAFVATGTNLQLMFTPSTNGYSNNDLDFDKEQGKVHIKSGFIMNGVCVRWRGWVDLERLDGVGCLEYDEERGQIEDAVLREQLEMYNQRMRDFEEKQRLYRAQQERQTETEVECFRRKRSKKKINLTSSSTTSPGQDNIFMSHN